MRARAASTNPLLRHTIFRLLINACWFTFRWVITAVVLVALGVGGYLYLQFDEELRRTLENRLATIYPDYAITIGSAKMTAAKQVSIFNVEIAPRGPTGAGAPILDVGELRVIGDFELRRIVAGETQLHRIEVRRPRLVATREATGEWNFQPLLDLPRSNGPPPEVDITGATVVLRQAGPYREAAPLTIQNVDASVETEQTAGGPPTHAFRVAVKDSVMKTLSIDGKVTPATGAVEVTLDTAAFSITNELLAALPGFDRLAQTGLRVDLQVSGKGSITIESRDDPPRWSGDLRITGGVIDHPLLPQPITGLAISAHATQNQLQVDRLSAQFAGAALQATGGRRGWTPNAPGAISWRLTGLRLDEQLYARLPEPMQKVWDRFRPTGKIDSTGSATFDGQRLRPDVTVTCRGVAFEDHESFPYRLTDTTGGLRYYDTGDPTKRGVLSINLIGSGEGRPIRVSSELTGLPCPKTGGMPADCPFGWIEVRGDAMKVTDKILAALPENARMITTALRPAGDFAFAWRLQRLATDAQPQTSMQLTAKDCAIQFDQFPYPLQHITGDLHERNGRWWFDNLAARSPGGQVVAASGALDPMPPGTTTPPRFRMRLTGAAAPLDSTLRNALPSHVQLAWDELRPRGRIDFTADVFCQARQKPRIDLVIAPHQRDLSIEPMSFPYRLEGIDGKFVFSDGKLAFDAARAHHGRTQIEGGGRWAMTPDQGWRLDLASLSVDRLDADHDFRLAAPIELRRVIARLDPQGDFGVQNGRLSIIKPAQPAASVATEWDMEFDFQQADLNGGLLIEDAAGSVRLAGRSQGEQAYAVGELQVDSLFWNGLQLTNVRGPLRFDKQQCLLGAAVATRQQGAGTTPRQVTADVHGGTAGLNAQIILADQPRYGAAVTFRNIDLRRFTSDYGRATEPLGGRMSGSFELQGLGATVYGLGGSGEVHIRDADFGDPTVLASMLKALRGRTPSDTTFNACDAKFRLQGEHISFEQLDLLGDAINLYGRGEARLDRSLDLAFRTIVRQGQSNSTLLRAFVGQASEQLLTIRVGGTLDEPVVRPETLPVVGNVLRQLQQNQTNAPGAARPTASPARRY